MKKPIFVQTFTIYDPTKDIDVDVSIYIDPYTNFLFAVDDRCNDKILLSQYNGSKIDMESKEEDFIRDKINELTES